MQTEKLDWQGVPCVRLTSGGYEALVLPQLGANCISLRHLATQTECLRTPPSLQAIKEAPNVYGLPILFPPNRIVGGKYTFEGRTYEFPINEPARNCHLHGVLSATPFEQLDDGCFAYRATAEKPYLAFPHAFTLIRSYELNEKGLTHQIIVTNESALDMPLGVGVHAAWRVSSPDARLQIPVREQWATDPHTIAPTGERITHSPLLDALRNGECRPEDQPLSCLLRCEPGCIRLIHGNIAFCFESDQSLPFCMLWNGGGGQGFVCPEPQSWLVNAPNLPWSKEDTGFLALAPGESRTYTLHYFVSSAL